MKQIEHGWLFIDFDDEQIIREYDSKKHLMEWIEYAKNMKGAFIMPPGKGIKAVDFLKSEGNYYYEKYMSILGDYFVSFEKFPNKFNIGNLEMSDYVDHNNDEEMIADYQGVLTISESDEYIPLWSALEFKNDKSYLKSISFDTERDQNHIFQRNKNLMSAFLLQEMKFIEKTVDVFFYEEHLLNENEKEIFYSFDFCPRFK